MALKFEVITIKQQILIINVILMMAFIFCQHNNVLAATINISAPADLTLSSIAGTGSSSGSITWNIQTDNAAGYKLEWQASSAALSSGSDAIAAYTPAIADTPETWSVAAADSEWGARLKSASTDSDVEWGTDDTSEKWLNVNNAAVRQVVSRGTVTPGGGSDEIVDFKVDIGANHFQPTGTYSVNITMTATTL